MKLIHSLLLIVFFCYPCINVNAYDTLSNKLRMLREYVEKNEPVYIINSDTFLIPKISRPPDSINLFLKYCKDNNVVAAFKYAFLPILKLRIEYRGNDFDFCEYHYNNSFGKNGIVDLAMHAMGIEFDSVGCSFIMTYEVYLWLDKHKKIYKGYKPIKKYMRKIGRQIKME